MSIYFENNLYNFIFNEYMYDDNEGAKLNNIITSFINLLENSKLKTIILSLNLLSHELYDNVIDLLRESLLNNILNLW